MTPETLSNLGSLQKPVQARLAALSHDRVVPRIWAKDAEVWKRVPELAEKIRNRLGWLTSIQTMQAQTEELRGLVRELHAQGFRKALLLGMGGSSLCPGVFAKTCGR